MDLLSAIMGTKGHDNVTDTNAHAGDFQVIYFKEDTVIATLVLPGGFNAGNSHDGETWLAGTFLVGVFSSITLTSGACVCYNRVSA